MNIIGFDFSINKPAACVLSNNKYSFFAWPYQLSEKYIEIYKHAGVEIIPRTDNKDKGETLTTKMIYEIQNSKYLAKLITETLQSFLNRDTYLAFEGLSYASSGDVVLQLGGYKYMLMSKLSEFVPLDHMYTYSPITVKSVAGCAKRGMGKSDMINEFIKSGPTCKFRVSLFEKQDQFMKKGGKTWIDNVDDFVDAFFVLRTLQTKEKLDISL
jgi:hypothetical protein